jgi:single-strand selective monofunctional uracil DNA glycosylase
MTTLTLEMTKLVARTKRLRFGPPVAFTYHPLDYAWPVAKAYFEKYGSGPKDVLLLGMNPGPFGMGQTGIPFGEVAAVKGFLGLSGEIKPPKTMHEKRPVLGWATTRSEVSGQRLWGAVAKKHRTAARFFERAFILNYCPILFLSESGANVALDKIDKHERKNLEAICDEALARCIAILKPKHLVGVGTYAAKRLAVVTSRDVVMMPHPSPASPTANRGWDAAARKALTSAGLAGLI